MRLKYVIVLVFSCLHCRVIAQDWDWAKTIGDTSGITSVNDMAVYQDNAFLIAGTFTASSMEMADQTLTNAGKTDIYAAILNENGTYQKAFKIGGAGDDIATAVAADAKGNIYLTGVFKSLTLNIGATTLTNKGESDAFLVKYNENSTVDWVYSIGTPYDDEITGLAVDKNGDVYIGGHTINNFASSTEQVFLAKLDDSQNVLWIRNGVLNSGSVRATAIVLDEAQNCFLTGALSGKLTFQGGNSLNSVSNSNGFIVQYLADGSFVKSIISTSMGRINAATAIADEIIVCGEKINYSFGWGWPLSDSKIYVARYNSNLNKVWEKSIGGEIPFESLDIAKAITSDEQGNIYLTGYFFSPKLGFAGDSLGNIFNKDYFYQQALLLKYDASGNEVWGKSLGSNFSDVGQSLLALPDNKVIIGGQFESDSLLMGNAAFYNTGALQEYYVHLRPRRYGRNAIAFLGAINNTSTVIRPDAPIGKLSVFPNPTTGSLFFSIDEKEVKNGVLSVFSADGRLCKTESFVNTSSVISTDVSNLIPGFYSISITFDHKVYTGRVFIH